MLINAFLAERKRYRNRYPQNLVNTSAVNSLGYVPAVLEWTVHRSYLPNSPWDCSFACGFFGFNINGSPAYQCHCRSGYKGNPYLENGCQDINECESNDPNVNRCGKNCVNTRGFYRCDNRAKIAIIVLKKRNNRKRKEKFFKRNGGLLLQQQLSSSEGGVQKTKLFSSKELETATDNYNENRVLGQGGQEFPLSWEMRLRIAIEIAGALSYLHSAASIPIYHRDIKSTNILLDEKYRAKVSDFGASRSVSLDQTHLTTLVQGTFGYLDPEYFQSSQFTDKSDVYSFGVVIVELLTGQKPISSTRSEEGRSLTAYFIHSMKENNLFEIFDPQVLKEAKKEELAVVASLAKRCLHLNGRKRPTMKEVAVELEGIRISHGGSTIDQQNYEEAECITIEMNEACDTTSTSTKSCFDIGIASSLDVQPLLSNTS
ncbi:hypothetical protein F0562_030624 [Nyssa sinensis]|uniref:Protein kinase domain-containing protein n=1 Tax=Nyssa sinensis TaxID=561372 RepID=A0A5J5B390_9ASTE|nr:hypothetical protein F0562_030624 [Nyssa sinensis]